MSVNLAIVEQIRQNVLATLAGIAVANGNQITLTVQSLLPAEGNQPSENLATLNFFAILAQGSGEREKQRRTQQKEYWWQDFVVEFYHLADVKDPQAVDYYLNLGFAEIANALLTDRTRSGLAEQTWIDSWTPAVSARPGEYQGLIITARVLYFTAESNCYSQ